MLKKFKKKIVDGFKDDLQFITNETTNFLIKKDYAKYAWANKKSINYYSEYFLRNLIKIHKYLLRDFKVKKDMYGDRMSEELTDLKKLKIQFYGKTKMGRKIKAVRVGKIMQRWQILCKILKEYDKILDFFYTHTKEKVYKDIDIDKERELIHTSNWLYEDFIEAKQHIAEDMEKVPENA